MAEWQTRWTCCNYVFGMTRNYKNYTDEDIIIGSSKVKSIAQLLEYLGLAKSGGNYYTVKKKLQSLNINTAHWTGQSWNKDQQLKDWSQYSRASTLKPHLIKERGHKCEMCNLSYWLDKDITLEIHHIDGDVTNNEYANLQLLCPNCHSYTDSWRKPK